MKALCYTRGMTTLLQKDQQKIHVRRAFHNANVAEWLEQIDEHTLAAMIDDYAFDEEIAAAIAYSEQHDDPKDALTVQEFLARECTH